LEAVEMAFRAALHQAGAATLGQLLQFPEPAAGQRTAEAIGADIAARQQRESAKPSD
jgi:hypothetical protein